MPDEMMAELDRGLIRLAKIIIGLVLRWLYLMAVAWWISPIPHPERVAPRFTETERRHVTTG